MELENSGVPRPRTRIDYGGVPRPRTGRSCTGSRSSSTVEPDVGEIEADELRFKQVRAQPAQQRREVHPRRRRRSPCAPRRSGADLAVTVTDTGIGVAAGGPRADLRVLPAGSVAARRKEEGTGLGLTPVQAHRRAAAAGGCGWRARSVPAAPSASPSRCEASSVVGARPDGGAGGEAERVAVLLVDDDRASLDLLAAYLEPCGRRGRAVPATARRRSTVVRRSAPAAVVLDIRLPGMDGWEVLRALKADPATQRHPRRRRVDRRRARPRHWPWAPSDYLIKPVSREDLIACPAGGRRARLETTNAGGPMNAEQHDPRRRGQRPEPQAGPGRARACGVRRSCRVPTGEEGVQLATDRSPDLVLMDLQLPGIDGTEALRQLRSQPVESRHPRRGRHRVRHA